MKTEILHKEAMIFADEAYFHKFQGNNDAAIEKFRQAFLIESEASFASISENIGQPTTSILFKSAAALALQCNETIEAEKLICHGLLSNPPFEIAEDLRNLLENVHFKRHLDLHGQSLDSSELQLVVAGKSIGYGVAKSEVIFDRIDALEQITYRTVERKQSKSFRGKGPVPKVVKLNFQPYMSVPRAASMAFTIRLGQSIQTSIEDFCDSRIIIDDILENIELVNNGKFEDLKEKINDDNYYKNFVSLSKELAPDGNDIKLVGLSVIRNGKQKDVEFTRNRTDISYSNFEVDNESQDSQSNKPIKLQGILSAADGDKNNIRLKTEGKNYIVIVPDGLNDIVKKYWKEEVIIKGTQERQNVIKLSDLDPV